MGILPEYQTGIVWLSIYFHSQPHHMYAHSKMNYSNYSSVISLELNDISLVDEGYIAYSAAGHGFGNEYPRVYFSSGEKIIIKRKENL